VVEWWRKWWLEVVMVVEISHVRERKEGKNEKVFL
jgi:hypothetical protein